MEGLWKNLELFWGFMLIMDLILVGDKVNNWK